MKKQRLIIITRIIFALLVAANIVFIFGNSAENGDVSKSKSDKVAEIVEPIINKDGHMTEEKVSFFVRKGAHFTEYTMLGGLSSLLYFSLISFDYKKIKAHCISVPAAVAAVASADETIQKFYERTSSIKDVLLDCAGGLFGIICVWVIYLIIDVIVIKSRNKRASESAEL